MKKVLILIPYENLYPPLSGGMLRCLHILLQLSRFYEVTAIINQNKESFLKGSEEFPELKKISIFSTHENHYKDIFSLLPLKIQNGFRYRYLRKSFKGPTDTLFLQYYQILKSLIRKNAYDIIVLENLATLKAVNFICRYQKKASVIYDVHNVDSNLAEQQLSKGLINESIFLSVKKVESTLYKTVDGLMVCSDNDLKCFNQMNKGSLNAAVIPNGVQLQKKLYNNTVLVDSPQHILFCGSLSYPPNVEGLLWFYKSIWPFVLLDFPALKLIVIGSGTPGTELAAFKTDPTIVYKGQVVDVKEYYDQAAISIVPLKSGSGTRLKVLEAMSLGVPVVSTSKGAEGIDYTDKLNIFIADSAGQFTDLIKTLITERHLRLQISENARELIRCKYDWNVIGDKMHNFLA